MSLNLKRKLEHTELRTTIICNIHLYSKESLYNPMCGQARLAEILPIPNVYFAIYTINLVTNVMHQLHDCLYKAPSSRPTKAKLSIV